MQIEVKLNIAGSDTGPFMIYSDVDGYTAAYGVNISKSNLLAGALITVPPATKTIKIRSNGKCTNSILVTLPPKPTTTTSTTSTSTTSTSTSTTTTTRTSSTTTSTTIRPTTTTTTVRLTTTTSTTRLPTTTSSTTVRPTTTSSTSTTSTTTTTTACSQFTITNISGKIKPKIYAGGEFDLYNGQSRNGIIRLSSDGTLDTTFNVGTGFNNTVDEIEVLPDGRVLVAGFFNTYNGINVWPNPGIFKGIALLNTDGSYAGQYFVGWPNNQSNTSIQRFKLQPDGKLLVGSRLNQFTRGYIGEGIGRFLTNGTLDPTFLNGIPSGNMFTSTSNTQKVVAIEVLPDGKIFIGGNIDEYDGSGACGHIVKLLPNGRRDVQFNRLNPVGQPDLTKAGFNGDVLDIKAQPDGKIVVGGFFSTYNGVASKRIARLNADGSFDTSFVVGVGPALSTDTYNNRLSVRNILIESNGKILVVGNFDSWNGITKRGIVRLNSDGTLDNSYTNLGPVQLLNAPSKLTRQDDNVIVSGYFVDWGGTPSRAITRLNSSRLVDTTFNLGGSSFDGAYSNFAVNAVRVDRTSYTYTDCSNQEKTIIVDSGETVTFCALNSASGTITGSC